MDVNADAMEVWIVSRAWSSVRLWQKKKCHHSCYGQVEHVEQFVLGDQAQHSSVEAVEYTWR